MKFALFDERKMAFLAEKSFGAYLSLNGEVSKVFSFFDKFM